MRLPASRLTFEVGPPSSAYKFQVLKRVCGVEVGVGLEGVEPKDHRLIIELCRRRNFFFHTVRSIVQWCDKLGVELDDFYVQFVFPAPFGPTVYGGRAIVGRRGRAVLEIESEILNGQLCVHTIDNDPRNPEKILCEDIIPHELMHILDVRQGRFPSIYAWWQPGEGEWLDLFRHLWIDGHLEERGFPHFPKEERIRELGEAVGKEKAKTLASAWWGKPMTMHDAVRLGLDAGLMLEPNCPIAIWYKNTRENYPSKEAQ